MLQGECSAILSTFIKLPFVIKILFCLFLSSRFTQVLLYIFSRVQVLFSTTHGETWHRLHEPCLPGQCVGTYFPVNTLYEAVDFDG